MTCVRSVLASAGAGGPPGQDHGRDPAPVLPPLGAAGSAPPEALRYRAAAAARPRAWRCRAGGPVGGDRRDPAPDQQLHPLRLPLDETGAAAAGLHEVVAATSRGPRSATWSGPGCPGPRPWRWSATGPARRANPAISSSAASKVPTTSANRSGFLRPSSWASLRIFSSRRRRRRSPRGPRRSLRGHGYPAAEA